MTTGIKFLTNPTSVFLQEGLNFHKLVESKVKSTKTCSLNHAHCRGLHTELVKGKGHTDNRKVNLPRTSEDTTMNCLKQKTSARKDSIESLFEKSRFSLEKIMGNSYTPNTKVQSGDVNKESDMSENETHRKKRIGLSSAKQNKSYIYSSANKTNVRLTKVSNSARKQVRDHDEGYLDSDYPNPQKKLVTNSDEHISRLHMRVSSQSIYTFCPINSDSKLEEVSTQHSPAKSSPSDYNFIKPNYSIHFPKVQDYELKSLYINESSRKSGSTASSIRTPSDSVKNWTVNGELNSDLFDFSYSQMSHPTRANSFELFDAESMSYGCDDSLCFAPVRNLGPSLFECIQSDEEELECEESFDPTFLTSSEKKPKDAEFSDIHFENEGVSFFSPAKDTETVQSQVSSGLDENHFDFLEALRVNQADYNVDPEHISSMQSEVNEGMRAILIDWMIEVCADFKLKRDTLYIAVAFLNKYLSSVPEVPGWKLQLAGVTSLLLAAKNEEVHVPRVEDFAKSTDDGYTSEQIREMELEMCKALKWRLNPITLYTLANYMMQCWDKYMDTFFQSESHKFGLEQSEMYFKQSNIKSCIKFREVAQILDLLLLNAQTLKYDMTALVVSVLYFVMGQASQKVTRDSIINCNCSFEQFMDSEVREFNTIFTIFLKEHLFPAFDGLKPVFEYVSPYFGVSFCFEAPNTIKENSKIEYKGHYEDFLSCQTHSPSNLSFVKGMMEGELSNKVEH